MMLKSAAFVVPSLLQSPPIVPQDPSSVLKSEASVTPSKLRSVAQHCPHITRASLAQIESHEFVQQKLSIAHTALQQAASLHEGFAWATQQSFASEPAQVFTHMAMASSAQKLSHDELQQRTSTAHTCAQHVASWQ
jgi:hypothetical protein